MKQKSILTALFVAATLPSHAASDLVNPLNTYSGNSQQNGNGNAQPTFLTTPPTGLEVSFLAKNFTATGAYETVFFNPTGVVAPAFPGVTFGANRSGGDGRNYFRTVEADYYTQDFTAFVTVKRSAPVAPATGRRAVFFGLGSGVRNAGFNNNPDQNTTNSSAYLELQDGFNNASRRQQTNTLNNNQIGYDTMTTVQDDSMRLRMQWNSVTRTIVYSIDYAYVPGATFAADQTFQFANGGGNGFQFNGQFNEWAGGDRASIFFGGEQSITFTDLVIDATQPAAPPIPTGLAVTSVGNQEVNLTWSSFAIPGTTYNVFRSATPNDPAAIAIATGLTATSFSDNAVTNPANPPVNGTTYYYTVTQSNTVALAAQSAKSNEMSAKPSAGALTPSGVIAVNGGKNALVIDWTTLLSTENTYTYTVRRSTTSGGTFTIPPGGSGLTESRFLDQNVVDGTTYFYTVTSTLGGNESPPTAEVSAASKSLEVFVDFNNNTPTNSGPGAVVPAPVGTSWNGIGLGSVPNLSDTTLTLSSVGLNATGQGNFSKGNGFNVGGDNTTPGSQTLTVPGGFDLMQDYVFQNGANVTTTYTLTGLVPGRKYDLYLYGYGDQLGQNTLFGANGILKQTNNPAGLTTLTQGRHYVTFTAVAEFDGTVPFTWRSSFGATDADANSVSALINGFQLVENSTAVLQPTDLSANGTQSGVDLSWLEGANVTSYKIYRSTNRTSGFVELGQTPAGTYTDTTGTAGITYFYAVTALNGSVESFLSAESSGQKVPLIVDFDLDGLSDSDEALIGTNPNDSKDFFKAKTSTVTRNGANFDISFVINGAQGSYVIERSTTLLPGSWTGVAAPVTWAWTTGVLDNLNLNATAVAPASGGKEFFRARGVVPTPAP